MQLILLYTNLVYVLSTLQYGSYVLYELRTTNAVLVEMTKIQQTMLSQIEHDVLPMRQFRGLTANRSFSCRIGDASAP